MHIIYIYMYVFVHITSVKIFTYAYFSDLTPNYQPSLVYALTEQTDISVWFWRSKALGQKKKNITTVTVSMWKMTVTILCFLWWLFVHTVYIYVYIYIKICNALILCDWIYWLHNKRHCMKDDIKHNHRWQKWRKWTMFGCHFVTDTVITCLQHHSWDDGTQSVTGRSNSF